jgi:L-threonylcarbamoyladenylate synthase
MQTNQIFIYPTDTIYGIGCNAENKELVEKIREIKQRDQKPFSIIAPSKNWILKNFVCKISLLDKYLPGPFTLILKKKNKNFLNEVSSLDTIGIRIPKHPFTKILQKTKKPIVTTSVNVSGQPFATKISEVDKTILDKVDTIFNYGTLFGKPSTLVIDGKEIKRD